MVFLIYSFLALANLPHFEMIPILDKIIQYFFLYC